MDITAAILIRAWRQRLAKVHIDNISTSIIHPVMRTIKREIFRDPNVPT